MIIDLKFPAEIINDMFPCDDMDGNNVQATEAAQIDACNALGLPSFTQLTWHLPDVFAVRYGSSYAATASANGLSVRFHSYEGDFQEGDDRV